MAGERRDNILEICGLKTQFKTRQGLVTAVDGVDLTIARGETFGLVGESGCGKSVTALSILRLLPKPAGRIAGGRILFDGLDLATLSEAEIKTLPLTSRNPYNFALLQPGVVGFENNEFGVARITANGALLRVNYQVDGSNNTQKDRAGLRQMPMSEVMIREVKVVTTGYAPEFGQTMGLVFNAITSRRADARRTARNRECCRRHADDR